MKVSDFSIEEAVYRILLEFDDPERKGLKNTPKRVAAMYKELLTPKDFNFTTFENEGYDEMIVQTDIPFVSLCEHHMVVFFGTVCIGYIPDNKIVGLSKLSRTVEYFSRRLQVQERLTQEIADFLNLELRPKGVGVLVKARHLCQEIRGVKKANVQTKTSRLIGVFKDTPGVREEFLILCQNSL